MSKIANRLILLGIGLNMVQWIAIFILFQKILAQFDGYTILNPNVTNGTMTSFSFIDWLQSMIYSGVPFNYIVFAAIVACLLYLIPTAVFIILEIIAYFVIRKNPQSAWCMFILAMGYKNIVFDLSGVPFLMAGLMMYKRK
ncbi:hypothetical protein [Gracilibacillus phocaeensis]|uniref:hypothetical protein n=1 Tax=Gracilibacillus phocaeensis TaxID=2042304 RepID=UPI00102F67CE|nr:hypothetical protein [Gracilibacillus phocaeensis]